MFIRADKRAARHDQSDAKPRNNLAAAPKLINAAENSGRLVAMGSVIITMSMLLSLFLQENRVKTFSIAFSVVTTTTSRVEESEPHARIKR